MSTEVLCESAGWVLFSESGRLVFADRGTSWRSVLLFVTAVLGFIALANGGVWLVVGFRSGRLSSLGLSFLAAAAVLLLAGWWLRGQNTKDLGTVPSFHRWVAVIDLEVKTLGDPDGVVLAPLDEVRFGPALQASSSSRALVATWSDGSLVVYRGSPFAGSYLEPLDVLRAYGLID